MFAKKASDVLYYMLLGNTIHAGGKDWKITDPKGKAMLAFKEGGEFTRFNLVFHKFIELVKDIDREQWLKIKQGLRKHEKAEEARIALLIRRAG